MSKHCIQVYKEIYIEVDDFIKAIPVEASFSEADYFITAAKASPEKLYNFKVIIRPAKSFTAKIDELTDRKTELEMKLE